MNFFSYCAKYRVLLTISVILLAGNAEFFPQNYVVKTYTQDDGLPSSTVNSIIQDELGRIWIGTRNGIAVYDGEDWEYHNSKNGLPSNEVSCLQKDSSGKIWALHTRRKINVSYFDGVKWTKINSPRINYGRNSNSRSINVIGSDSKTQLLVTTSDNGVYYYSNSQWKNITQKDGLPSNYCKNVVVIDNKFYIATSEGIAVIKNGVVDQSFNKILPGAYKEVLALSYENKRESKRLWVLSKNCLGYIENGKFYISNKNISLRDNIEGESVQFVPNYFGLTVFGNQFELKFLDTSTGKYIPINEQSGIRVLGPYCIFLDKESNLWLGGFSGINKLRSMRFATFRQRSGLLKDEVTAIIERRKDEIIFGHVSGLSILENEKIKHIEFNSGKNDYAFTKVLDLCKDNLNNIWFAAENFGVGRLDLNGVIKWYKIKDVNTYYSNSIVQDNEGNIYTSSNSTLSIFKNGKFNEVTIHGLPQHNGYRKLFVSPANELYIATYDSGILVVKDEKYIRTIRSESNERANSVYSVYFEPTGKTLVGTYDGIYEPDGNSLKKINFNIESREGAVYFITKDNNNNYWFGTDRGVIKRDGNKTYRYTLLHGLAGLETNRDAGFVASDGRVWIGTDRGVSKYLREFDLKPNVPPTIIIDSIEPRGGLFEPTGNEELIASSGLLVVKAKVISLIDESHNRFQYKLEGVDKDWIFSEGRDPLIRYANLSPGKYRLLIKGQNAEDVWSRDYSVGNIIVPQPFFNSLWYYLMLIIFSALIFFAFINYRTKTRYSKKLFSEVEKRTELLNDSESRYRQMFEKNHSTMLLIDAETLDIIDVNEAAERFYGFDKSTLINLNYLRLSTAGSVEDIIEKIENSILVKKQKLSVHRIKSGVETFVEVSFSKISIRGRNLYYAIIHDVGARIKAEEGLKESEEKYRTLIESMIDGVFVIQNELFLYVNKTLADFVGYKPEEMINKSFQMFIAPEDVEMVHNRYKARLAGEEITNEYIIKLLHKDGISRVHVIIHVSVFRYKSELASLGTVKNITESIMQELKIKQFHTAIEQAPIGVMITNFDDIIEYANPKFCQISGYNYSEIIGRKPFILQGKKSVDESERIRITVRQGKIWSGEVLNKRKDGSTYWALVTVSPIRNSEGEITHFISMEHDITFEKYAREEIKRNEKLLSTILNHVPVIITAVNKRGYITFCRGKELENFGTNNDTLVGQSILEKFANSKSLVADFKKALEGEAFSSVAVFDKGTAFEIHYTPILSENGEIAGSIAVASNITERYYAQQKLIAAKEEAERSDRLKSDFLAQMSHEIRTPVNTILSFISLLEEEIKNKISDELSEVFNFIDDGGRRLIRTIDMILNMSQFQTGTYKPIMHTVDLSMEVLSKIVSELRSTAKHKNLFLNLYIETENTYVKADSYTIGQIFINLIDNAIKYTHHGKIDVKIRENKEKIIVDVEDTGIGIARDYIPHLFDAFSQEETGYSRRFEGTGLGLALVKKYIEINEAEIKVESLKGEGTKFSVYFNKIRIKK